MANITFVTAGELTGELATDCKWQRESQQASKPASQPASQPANQPASPFKLAHQAAHPRPRQAGRPTNLNVAELALLLLQTRRHSLIRMPAGSERRPLASWPEAARRSLAPFGRPVLRQAKQFAANVANLNAVCSLALVWQSQQIASRARRGELSMAPLRSLARSLARPAGRPLGWSCERPEAKSGAASEGGP